MYKYIWLILGATFFLAVIQGNSSAMMCTSQHSEHQYAQASKDSVTHATKKPVVNVDNKVCPVSGEKIDERLKATYEYEGKVYNFCCPACIEEFKKEPAKYIKKIEQESQARFQEEIKKETKKETVPVLEPSGHGHMH